MRRRALLMGGKKEPNTIIGGIGGTINTKALLAAKLGVSESIIRNFEVVGSDVHAYINSSYHWDNGFAFQNDTSITFFDDLEGKCLSTNTSIFYNTPNLTRLYMPSITALVVNFIYNTPLLVDVTFGNLTHIGTNGASDSSAVFPTNFVTSLGSSAFVNNKHIIIDLTSMTSIPNSPPFRGATLATHVYMGNVVTISNSQQFFQNLTSCEYIDLKKLKTYGIYAAGASAFNLGFQNLKMNCQIDVNIAMATANAGNPHEAFVWVKTNRNATVDFYDDSGNYVSTL